MKPKLNFQMKSIIGIDLGTTYSAVAQFDTLGRLKMVDNQDGDFLIPSCVALIDDKFVVGLDASMVWATDQGREQKSSAARFKREMGTSKLYRVGPHSLSPVELSSNVLKYIAQFAEKASGEFAPVVITVPANFSNEARQATMDAAKSAGLEVLNIINEPTAAALYYAFEGNINQTGTYAIFDLGGGTFDITIANFDGKNVEVKWSDGIARLGGIDFDKALQTIVKEKYEGLTSEELSPESMSHEGIDLLRIQEMKKTLSRQDKVSIFVKGQVIEVTREEFESSISKLVAQIRLCCENTLAESELTADDLDGVILAGGSTRIPVIQECIREVFCKEPMSIANVDEVVALGAALYAAYRIHEDDPNMLNEMQRIALGVGNDGGIKPPLKDVANKNFGTVALRWSDDTESTSKYNSIIIERGTPIPHSVTESYYTVSYNQRIVKCRVTECDIKEEDMDSEFVKIIGRASLPLPPGRPANQEVLVTYKYDEDQIMHCSFRDVESGEEIEIVIEKP